MTDPRALLDFVAALQHREELPVNERLKRDAESQRKMREKVDAILKQWRPYREEDNGPDI